MLHYLWQISYADAVRHIHGAGSGTLKSYNKLHQGTLPRPVLAAESYLVPLGNMEINPIQQCKTAVTNSEIVYGNHCSCSFRTFRNFSGQAMIRPVSLLRKPRTMSPSAQSTPS